MNPYEKKPKAETSKDQPVQPGTALLKADNKEERCMPKKRSTRGRSIERKGFAWGLVPLSYKWFSCFLSYSRA